MKNETKNKRNNSFSSLLITKTTHTHTVINIFIAKRDKFSFPKNGKVENKKK